MPITVLQSSMLPDLVDILETIAESVPNGEPLYDQAKDIAQSSGRAILDVIKDIATTKQNAIEAASDVVKERANTAVGLPADDVKAYKDTAEDIAMRAKVDINEAVDTATDIYYDRK